MSLRLNNYNYGMFLQLKKEIADLKFSKASKFQIQNLQQRM